MPADLQEKPADLYAAGPQDPWCTAVPDWAERLLAGKSLVPDLPLFDDQAQKALRIFKRLRVPDLQGNPTYGEVCRPWVFDLVRAIFGSYDPETRRRMIREFFVLVPKKNGKSAIAAAIIVVAAIVNERPEAELLLIAPTKIIADISYKQASGIIRLDKELSKLFWPKAHQRTILHRLTHASISIKAADTDVITGGKSAFTLIDETHVFSKKARAADVFVELRGALASRPEGFLLQITTQSKDPPSGVFKSELMTARDVRDGKMRLPLLALTYELPFDMQREDGWMDEASWGKVNPNLGASVDLAFLRDEVTKAKRDGPHQMALIASQHFNVQVGIGLHAEGWAGARYWARAADPEPITLDSIIERCEVATIGVDGGGLDDLLGLSVCGRDAVTKDWLFWFRAWAHPDALEQRKENIAHYRQFEQQGDLVICDDGQQDVREVAAIIGQLNDAGLLPEKHAIGLDPVGVAAIIDELDARGITNDQMSAVGQGYRLSGTIKGMERKLKDGTLWHDGSDMMAWCVGNAKAELKGSALLITKEVAGSAKIDPLIAGFNAFALMARNPDAGQLSPTPWDADPEFRMVV